MECYQNDLVVVYHDISKEQQDKFQSHLWSHLGQPSSQRLTLSTVFAKFLGEYSAPELWQHQYSEFLDIQLPSGIEYYQKLCVQLIKWKLN